MRPRRSTVPFLVHLAPVVFVGAVLAPAVSAAGAPGNIVWDSSATSPDRATRSLRFRVEPPATATGLLGEDAIKVTMVDLQNPDPPNAPCCPPQNFSTYESATCAAAGETNGCARWVGKPGTFLELQGVPGWGSYRAARLQCTPFYFDWVTETATMPITVVGAEILPSSEYSVKTYGSSCVGIEATCTDVGTAVTMQTRRSGDVASVYNPPSTTRQPDGLDIAVMINKFKARPGAPTKAVAKIQPNLPELNSDINALDIVTVADAFLGFAYPFPGPCPCPSLVTCGGSCTGCSGMCVKTCSGSGDPCINNGHCPTGETCGNPLCRDKCGRCTP